MMIWRRADTVCTDTLKFRWFKCLEEIDWNASHETVLISCSYYICSALAILQHNEHAAFSSALPVSTFSTLSANTKIQITGTWCTVGSGVVQPNTVGAAVCCGHEQHGVILPSVLDVANNGAMCDKQQTWWKEDEGKRSYALFITS